jgi:hypothetical protein
MNRKLGALSMYKSQNIKSLAVAILALVLSSGVNAALVELSNPVIIGSAPAFPGYEAHYALDGDLTTDYASAGFGTNTFLDFDFGVSTLIAEVSYSDRTSSGGPNGSNVQGPSDNVTSFNLIFSDDLNFGDALDKIVFVDSPGHANTDIVSINLGDGFTSRFLRWDVVSISGPSNNVGAAEFSFSTVPVPTTVWLFGSGLIGLIGVARRK